MVNSAMVNPPVQSIRMTGADKPHFAQGMGGGLGVSPYSVAENVMVFSNRKKAWVEAQVNAVHRDGSCDVQYTESREIKQVKLEDQPTAMKKVTTPGVEAHQRVSVTTGPLPTQQCFSVTTAPLPHHGQNGSVFAVQDRVEVFSQSWGAWRMAEVVCVHKDGRCDVKYVNTATDSHTGEEKSIPLEQQAAFMRSFR